MYQKVPLEWEAVMSDLLEKTRGLLNKQLFHYYTYTMQDLRVKSSR